MININFIIFVQHQQQQQTPFSVVNFNLPPSLGDDLQQQQQQFNSSAFSSSVLLLCMLYIINNNNRLWFSRKHSYKKEIRFLCFPNTIYYFLWKFNCIVKTKTNKAHFLHHTKTNKTKPQKNTSLFHLSL